MFGIKATKVCGGSGKSARVRLTTDVVELTRFLDEPEQIKLPPRPAAHHTRSTGAVRASWCLQTHSLGSAFVWRVQRNADAPHCARLLFWVFCLGFGSGFSRFSVFRIGSDVISAGPTNDAHSDSRADFHTQCSCRVPVVFATAPGFADNYFGYHVFLHQRFHPLPVVTHFIYSIIRPADPPPLIPGAIRVLWPLVLRHRTAVFVLRLVRQSVLAPPRWGCDGSLCSSVYHAL